MFNIQKLNKISPKIDSILADGYNIVEENPDAVILRSFSMHEWAAPENLLAVARAGAGVNNIPCDDYAKKGIVVFNTPGANANGVKELIICAMLLASRDIVGGIAWAQTLTGDDVKKQVEKGKGQFAGTEIMGKTIGILGLGAIGRKVAQSAHALGMNVIGYDPFLSDTARASIPFVTVYDNMDAVYAASEFLTLHLPYTADTKNMINAEVIEKMPDGAILINCARGELVKTSDVISALASGKLRKYVTDFPDGDCLNNAGIITIPHLGASTEEAEDNCAVMAANELRDFLENGNIVNSVNLPSIKLEATKAHRATVIGTGESVANMFDGADCTVAKRGDYYYLICDSDSPIDLTEVSKAAGVIRVRNVF